MPVLAYFPYRGFFRSRMLRLPVFLLWHNLTWLDCGSGRLPFHIFPFCREHLNRNPFFCRILFGKLFVEFVALIYLSYIKKKMEEAGLFSRYTMHELLDELDVIECFTEPGKSPIQGEVLKKQEQIYRDLGVTPLMTTPEIGK